LGNLKKKEDFGDSAVDKSSTSRNDVTETECGVNWIQVNSGQISMADFCERYSNSSGFI
jgi:hypothetical protein